MSLHDKGTGEKMTRVTADHPCRVCEKPDWCLYNPDGSAAICSRIQSQNKRGDAGWLHLLGEASETSKATQSKPNNSQKNWPEEAAKFAKAFAESEKARNLLAKRLRLPVEAFLVLPLIGCNPDDSEGHCWTFPMVDAKGTVVGILRRFAKPAKSDGKMKKVAAGGHLGLTIPEGWQERPGPLFLPEGPTDVLAMSYAGLSCVGRPSNRGKVELLAEFLSNWPADREIIVVGELDKKTNGDWPGKLGAESTANELAARLNRAVKVTLPPADPDVKDCRDWLTHSDRGETPWPDRGMELANSLIVAAVVVEPPPVFVNKFNVGDRVSPTDRDNIGTITEVKANGRYEVEFISKSGDRARKTFPESELRPLASANPTGGQPPANPPPPYCPFPVEALPPTLREFVTEIAASVDADPAFAALPALTLAGAAVGASLAISPKRRFEEPPAIWTCTVGDSGTGKSPCFRPSAKLAHGIGKRLKAKFNEAYRQYIKDLAEWKNAEEPDPEKKPRVPIREYFIVSDITIERLAEMAGTSPRGLLLNRDELSGWYGSFTRYKGKSGGSDTPNWLSMYDAGPISYHRRTGEPRDVEAERAFIGVAGGIQPGVLCSVLADPNFIDSGMAARLMFAWPPKACPRWSEAELSEATESAFRVVLDRLRELPFDEREGPFVIRLSVQAKERFKSLNNEFAETAEGIDGGPMAAVLPKAVRFALRLALIWHCVNEAAAGRDPAKDCVGDEAMQAGETLARWFVNEAERIYAMVGETPETRTRRLLVALIQRKGGTISVRDLMRANNREYPHAAAARTALDALVKAGLGEWTDRVAMTTFVLARRTTTHDTTADDENKSHDEPHDTRSEADSETPQNSADSEDVSGNVGRRAAAKEEDSTITDDEARVTQPENPSEAPPKKRRFRSKPNRGVPGQSGGDTP